MLKIRKIIKGLSLGTLAIMMFCVPANASKYHFHKSHHQLETTYIYSNHKHNTARRHRRKHTRTQYNSEWIHKEVEKIYRCEYNTRRPLKKIHHNAACIYEHRHNSIHYNHHKFMRISSNNTLMPINHATIHSVESQLNYWSLRDVNKDRLANNLCSLKKNAQLSHLANIRVKQSEKNFSHVDSNGTPYVADDAHYVGMSFHKADTQLGENLISAPLGQSVQDDDPTNYYSRNGHDLADEDENSMVNYDNDGGGHRMNIMDNTTHNIGIASSYDSANNNFYLAEEFE